MGVPTRVRVDRALEQNPTLLTNVPIINIDFHRSNENYGAVNLIEPTAASLSEMLVSLSESLQNGIIDETIATAILTGIISSTDRFTAQHTTPKTLTVAAQMMAAGAKQQQVVKGLYRRDNRDNRGDRPGGSRPAAPVAPKPAPVQTTSPQPAPPPSQPAQPVVRTPEPVSEPQSSHDEPASQPDSARPVDELPLISEMIEQPHPYVDGSGSVLADEPAPADSSYVNANSYRS